MKRVFYLVPLFILFALLLTIFCLRIVDYSSTQKEMLGTVEKNYKTYQYTSRDALTKKMNSTKPNVIARRVVKEIFGGKDYSIVAQRYDEDNFSSVYILSRFPKWEYFLNYDRIVGGVWYVVVPNRGDLIYYQSSK